MQLAEAQSYLCGQPAAIRSPPYPARPKVERTVQVTALHASSAPASSACSFAVSAHRTVTAPPRSESQQSDSQSRGELCAGACAAPAQPTARLRSTQHAVQSADAGVLRRASMSSMTSWRGAWGADFPSRRGRGFGLYGKHVTSSGISDSVCMIWTSCKRVCGLGLWHPAVPCSSHQHKHACALGKQITGSHPGASWH